MPEYTERELLAIQRLAEMPAERKALYQSDFIRADMIREAEKMWEELKPK